MLGDAGGGTNGVGIGDEVCVLAGELGIGSNGPVPEVGSVTDAWASKRERDEGPAGGVEFDLEREEKCELGPRGSGNVSSI
jgi:hypothetical protein